MATKNIIGEDNCTKKTDKVLAVKKCLKV